MRRVILIAFMAVVAAAVGPRVVGPQSHSAGAPFVYEPPEGFVPAKDAGSEANSAQAWIQDLPSGVSGKERRGAIARIVLTHSSRALSVDESDLAKLAQEMPKAFEDVCTWVLRRNEMRVRADNARVGLIEGDCELEVKTRKLQLIFPDDTGTQIVTASYPADEAAHWEPLFEATIGKARGVAVRVPAPSPWLYLAWGAAGAVLGWLATALGLRKETAT